MCVWETFKIWWKRNLLIDQNYLCERIYKAGAEQNKKLKIPDFHCTKILLTKFSTQLIHQIHNFK